VWTEKEFCMHVHTEKYGQYGDDIVELEIGVERSDKCVYRLKVNYG